MAGHEEQQTQPPEVTVVQAAAAARGIQVQAVMAAQQHKVILAEALDMEMPEVRAALPVLDGVVVPVEEPVQQVVLRLVVMGILGELVALVENIHSFLQLEAALPDGSQAAVEGVILGLVDRRMVCQAQAETAGVEQEVEQAMGLLVRPIQVVVVVDPVLMAHGMVATGVLV